MPGCMCIPCIQKPAQLRMWVTLQSMQDSPRSLASYCLLRLVLNGPLLGRLPWHTIYKKFKFAIKVPPTKVLAQAKMHGHGIFLHIDGFP
eukprot:scaffold810_cov355-Pavlova_lutheri.AAC.3